jgi:hypothetical protein
VDGMCTGILLSRDLVIPKTACGNDGGRARPGTEGGEKVSL